METVKKGRLMNDSNDELGSIEVDSTDLELNFVEENEDSSEDEFCGIPNRRPKFKVKKHEYGLFNIILK